jgi:hypothetical protein
MICGEQMCQGDRAIGINHSEQWGCQPTLMDRLGQPLICQKRAAARLWRYDFRHDATVP